MMSKFNDLEELFREIDARLKEKVRFYLIGGAVMLHHGMKTLTKDVDVIVDSHEEFKATENLLKEMGFESKIPSKEYRNFDLSQIFVREDARIDLFQKSVCKGFILSKNMMKRSETLVMLNNLSVSLCSTTDVFMFKTFTERQGDIEDCLLLAQKEIDWNGMLAEIKSQIRASGQKVWITYIGERLNLLEDRNLVIPIMKDIDRLREKFFDELEKKQSRLK